MRTLGSTLTATQKAMGEALCKVVIVKSGQTTRAYGVDTTNRIVGLSHIEQEWSQIANIAVQSDSTLAALSLEGYTGTISYGYYTGVSRSDWVANHAYSLGDFVVPTTANGYQYKCTTAGTSHATTEPTWGTTIGGTTADYGTLVWTLDGNDGDEYSACAPLEVVGQKTDTNLRTPSLTTYFSLAGVFDLMAQEEASEVYTPTADNQDTVKDILTAIAGATLTCFSHCKVYTITFDSEDSLIDTFIPAEYFHVAFREKRLSAFKKALGWTKCKARIEDDGAIHIFNPTVSGSSYNYEYNDAATYHNFFEKGTRKRLVIPSRVYVESHPDQGVYTGNAADSTSYTALGRYIDEYHWLRVTSNAQCTAIATAIMQNYQVGAEKGHGIFPINCGQEVMDYINITDSVASDTRAGNVGYIKRDYTPSKFNMELRFGKLTQGSPLFAIPTSAGGAGGPTYEDLQALLEYVNELNAMLLEWFMDLDELVLKKLEVTEQLIIPHWGD